MALNCTSTLISTNPHLGQQLAEVWAQTTGQPHALSLFHLRIKKKGDKDEINYDAEKAFGLKAAGLKTKLNHYTIKIL